jgi:hypothetical protein
MTFDEGLAMLDGEVEPKFRPRLRSMIRDAASKQAAIRFDEGGVDGRSAELQARAERNALSFAQDFARMVRLACHRHRLLQFDVNLYALLRDTLNNVSARPTAC